MGKKSEVSASIATENLFLLPVWISAYKNRGNHTVITRVTFLKPLFMTRA